ncbi:MAG: DUF2344 domain-containing protein [Elusimicrobia bacterium]|nr:DUF2344 domain-containing protein [Elusimicrobiota bacterium]
MRFLSHLEQIEAFRRAFRRSGLPLTWSGGKGPQLRLAFGVAISVGHASDAEYVDAWFTRRVDPVACAEQLKAQLPQGFVLHTVKRIPLHFPSLESLMNLAHYEVQRDDPTEQWEEAVQRWYRHPIEILEKPKGGKIERIALPPLIRQISAQPSGVDLWLRFGAKRHVKPEWIIQRLLPAGGDGQRPFLVVRLALYGERSDGSLYEP